MVALSQIVPGPGSSPVGFALGYIEQVYRVAWLRSSVSLGLLLLSMVYWLSFGSHWQEYRLGARRSCLKAVAVVDGSGMLVSACWRSFCQSKTNGAIAFFV